MMETEVSYMQCTLVSGTRYNYRPLLLHLVGHTCDSKEGANGDDLTYIMCSYDQE